MHPNAGSSNQPLGTSGSLRRRLFLHHVPLALASAVVLVLFTRLPAFDASRHPHADLFSSALPQPRSGNHTGQMGRDGGTESMGHGAGAGAMRHGGSHTGPMRHGGGQASGPTSGPNQIQHRAFTRQFTLATGYVALGLLALTLLVGPANLLLGRRNPVSSHLRRDLGAWTAVASIAHVVFGLQVHGGGRISAFLDYFIARDGDVLLNSFGLGNWTGLGAVVIVVGLLAISSDAALRKLKARPWKRLQRLNYVLFALVILHAFFYGALLRLTSPFTLLLGLSVIAVFLGQAVGIRLWRLRLSRTTVAAG